MTSSLLTVYAILLLSWMMFIQYTSADLSKKIDFYTFFNGYFDNIDQTVEEGGMHDKIVVDLKPVLLPQLSNDPMIYIQQEINGQLYLLSLATVTVVPTTNIFNVTFYNFTDTTKQRLGSFNTDNLATLTREDLHTTKDCRGYYEYLKPCVLLGQVPDCQIIVNQKHPLYFVTFTCDRLRYVPPTVSKETIRDIRYYLKRRGPRYSVFGAPEGYVSICKDKQ